MKILPITTQTKYIPRTKQNKVETNQPENKILEFPSYAQIKYEILFKGTKNLSKERIEELKKFQEKYNLNFSDINILNQAFLYGVDETGKNIRHNDTYERLEFIGDDVLELCVNKMLYENYPNKSENELTKLKQQIVCNENISKYSKQLELDKMVPNHIPINKRLADIFEALLGAIFIDGKEDGFKNVYKFFEDNLKEDILSKKIPQKKSSKTILEEYIVNNGGNLQDLNHSTIFRDRMYICEVSYKNELLSKTKAGSERKARANAFQEALIKLNEIFES